MKYLGDTFDIHGGGRELIFPHHENEIAQSEAATHKPFVKYWMHNGLMQLRGEKMSKSTGVLVPISELLERHAAETVRYFLLSSHYRNPIDFSEERLEEARRALEGFHLLFGRIQRITGKSVYELGDDYPAPDADTLSQPEKDFLQRLQVADEEFHLAMDDDFNTAGAIAALFTLAADTNKFIDAHSLEEPHKARETEKELLLAAGAQIRRLGKILGLLEYAIYEYVASGGFEIKGAAETRFIKAKEIKALVNERNEARSKGDYKEADRIRSRLAALGIILEDTPSGTIWRRK
jgi:cysteinyl-tRNA synthetase